MNIEELLGGFADANPGAKPEVKRQEKGVVWEAKVIDGSYYVPLSQVAELLAVNDVLPAVRRGIERRVQKGA